MCFLKHFHLTFFNFAVIYVLFSEPQQYSGTVHVVVHNLIADICSNETVILGRGRIAKLDQMSLYSFYLGIFEEKATSQSTAIKDYVMR